MMGVTEKVGSANFDGMRIPSEDLTVYFATKSLIERRGVGQVSRTLHKAFKELSYGKPTFDNYVTFYSFFQDCLTNKLRNSVLLVHDISMIVMPDYLVSRESYKESLRRACDNVDHIVVCGMSTKPALNRLFGIPLSKITVINNPIESEPVIADIGIDLPSQPYLLHACSGNRYKNVEILFKAWEKLKTTDLKLVVLGRTFENHSLINSLGIRDRIIFMDRVSRNEVNYLMKNSIGVLTPSRSEGFGLVPLEAAVVGAPSIIATGNNMSDAIRENEAFWCDPDDEIQWATRIDELYQNGDDGRASRLRERISVELHPTRIAKEYLKVFQIVINENKA